MAHTAAIARGCGSRVAGGAYLECGFSKYGRPLEHFIVCPPIPVNKDALGLSDVGVKLIKDERGIYHVFDIIGAAHYPNVCDFGEEVRRYGVSRRISATTDFHLLTRESRLILLHRRGYIHNSEDYFRARTKDQQWTCPREHAHHMDRKMLAPMCASLWWEDITIADKQGGTHVDGEGRILRHMPSFGYTARLRPAGIEPQYQLAICFSFPITNIAVIAETNAAGEIVQGGDHERLAEKLSRDLKGIGFSVDKS